MEKIIVRGGATLRGRVAISGAKNAVLPVIAACLLTEEECRIAETPNLADVATICEVLKALGAGVSLRDRELIINCRELTSHEPPYHCVRRMRASFLVMGSLLARTGRAKIAMPGGCAIGSRPIDLHLKGFAALGADITINHGVIEARAQKLKGNRIYLDFPSVGATENLMMAAAMARGTTVIENAAEEPEIVDLANFINSMGGRITGAGTNIIKVEGVERLRGTFHTVIPDRIEAGTFMVAAAATGGEVLVENVIVDHLKPVVAKLREIGAEIKEEPSGVRVSGNGELRAVDVKTLPYPGFPTDMQAQIMALLTAARGTSVITETVFENRFMHVNELKRMGAQITIEGHAAVVKGVDQLMGAPVKATDLRAGAALIIAGLMAQGETEIGCIHHIDRGYEDIVGKLRKLGADIERVDN
ncbi:UDP-N-acetylglucosamine 1-carboxyvinyltransferase [Calderihabitans maritimus]|uniref:UDP-N-acetylglucosamine 1-carboxyvinyltransferase n=1 Tax=Calderihabitans maritimus TaxID=1246530 RepID=A0A1Z5HWC8_9FIRM|nr:UDP-N-acetylglucosamine 1-carboxyvinyltransferase [Calderihabitans maritimus]GAW93842.1 UDP-N-acetylglucosamine 1-carboxyvinyltransferase [Calderihabitans maritimus]